jgi:hypothetical protein
LKPLHALVCVNAPNAEYLQRRLLSMNFRSTL